MLPTRMNHGIVNALHAQNVRLHWLASVSPAVTKSPTAPNASASYLLRDALLAPSQSPVTIFNTYFQYLTTPIQTGCWLIYFNTIMTFSFNRHWRHPFHFLRGSPLAQRLLYLRQLQDVVGGPWLYHRRFRHHMSRVC